MDSKWRTLAAQRKEALGLRAHSVGRCIMRVGVLLFLF